VAFFPTVYLRRKFAPSPVYPDLHLHSYDPGVFTQSAFDEQLTLLAPGVLHSFISAKVSLAVIFSLEHVVLQIIQTTDAGNNKGQEKEKNSSSNNSNNNKTF